MVDMVRLGRDDVAAEEALLRNCFTSPGNDNGPAVIVPVQPLERSASRKSLYFAAFSANLLFISSGCALTWTSPAITKLKHHNLTEEDIAWISSVQAIGAIFGPALYSLGIDRLGRKGSLLLNAGTFLISWLLLGSSADSVALLLAGRFIGGLGVGACFNSVPVYITEVSDAESRQMLTSMTELFVAAGYVLTYSIGPYVDLRVLSVVCALPAVVFVVMMAAVPESPYHYLAGSKKDDAIKALRWLRETVSVNTELDLIQAAVSEAKEKSGSKKDLFLKKGPRLGLCLTLLMLSVQQASAVDVITTYTEQIFQRTDVPLTPSSSAIIVGIVNFVSSFAAAPVVKRFGSKSVLVVCAFICGISLLGFGGYQYWTSEEGSSHHVTTSLIKSIPLICILTFNVFFCIGVGSLPWAISAELFPPSIKGFALMVSGSLAWSISFLLIYSYGRLHLILGTSTLFFFYGTCEILGSILILRLVPNTRGKTLKQVTDILENGKARRGRDTGHQSQVLVPVFTCK